MELSRETSQYYAAWLEQSELDFVNIKQALQDKIFSKLGELVEANSEAMHAVMQTTLPSIVYSLPQTLEFKHKVWQARKDGIEVYFTQDAGANLKIIFEDCSLEKIREYFPEMEIFL
jgi:diphosphomevalonate decarboxylase